MEPTNPQDEGRPLGLDIPLLQQPENPPDLALYASSKIHATAANASLPDATLNPDDFYRNYRGVESANPLIKSYSVSQDPVSSAGTVSTATPKRTRMAAAAGFHNSLRSNLNGAAPKPPATSSASLSHRAGLRSASAPVDRPIATRTSAARAAAVTPGTSVKDLKKKFDQAGTSASSSQKSSSRVSSRSGSPSASGRAKSSAHGPTSTSYSTLRSAAGRDTTRNKPRPGTHRQKTSAEDQAPNNSQSFASRSSKLRSPVSPKTRAPRSGSSRLTPEPAQILPKEAIVTPPRSHHLLFGEVPLSQEAAAQSVGFGIENTCAQRTSESNLDEVPKQHQRSFSDPDVDLEPQSPTDWYRGASRPPAKQRAKAHMARNHGRAQSDLATSRANGSKVNRNQEPPGSSRIPLSVRKLSSPVESTSPTSSGAPSPSKSSTPKPPISSTSSRTKTPARLSTGKREASSQNSNRLTVSISSPPPKKSPQLRSSRPRQPVSCATTASSRLKMVEKAASRQAPPENRRRKISIGPIDFEQRREHIRLAYTKSIRASQVLEAKQVAAEIKRREAEAAAKALLESQEKGEGEIESQVIEQSQSTETDGQENVSGCRVGSDSDSATSFETSKPPVSTDEGHDNMDSPTLGIPGSFPVGSPAMAEEEPKSAVSNTSVITDFDNEEQTEPPQAKHESLQKEHQIPRLPSPIEESEAEKATYRLPACFDEEPPEEQMKIPISLDAPSSVRISSRNRGGEPLEVPEEPVIPGAFRDEYEDEASVVHTEAAPQPEPEVKKVEEEQKIEVEEPPESLAEKQPGMEQNVDEEYEPRPYKFQSSGYGTTVTIVSRESTFPPNIIDNGEANDRASAYIIAEEDQNDYQIGLDSVDARTLRHVSRCEEQKAIDETQPEDALNCVEQFYVGSHFRDSVSLSRDSTLDSREVEQSMRSSVSHAEQSSFTSTESQQGPETKRNLNVLSLLTPASRVSHHSAWTDFSVDSVDSIGGKSSRDEVPPMPPLERKSTAGSDSVQIWMSHDDGVQPRSSSDVQSGESLPRHQLPELDTGGGLSLPYLVQQDKTPKVPEHAPPAIPEPAHPEFEASQHSANGFYDLSRPASLHSSTRDDRSSFTMGPSSPRESRDFYRILSERPSLDETSFDSADGNYTPASGADMSSVDISRPEDGSAWVGDGSKVPDVDDQAEGRQALSGKEKGRLLQRQMVIRELVDTEAVFIRDMNIVEEIYKGTAEACPKLDVKTIKLIFRNTDEIIAFHTGFISELRDAVSTVYNPKGRRSPLESTDAGPSTPASTTTSASLELDDGKDRQTSLGPSFIRNVEKMKVAHEVFLKNSDQAAKRLQDIQEDSTIKVWLHECNEVAKDLTQAWDLDSLLIKPMQRLTKYPNLIAQLLQYTPANHPDREPLMRARITLEEAILDINKTKKNFELVGQIVGRKRKESEVRAGLARVLGKRVDKLQASNRPPEDTEYAKLHERFGDDYLRLQVVLRDVEFYTRQVSAYVHEFLQYLSSMELVMRLQPSPYPELESKWVRFNVSMRDIEKVALEQHLSQVRKHVIEPFELVIKSYGNPSLAMKKRAKRRLDYERSIQLKKSGKKIDKLLSDQVEQYDALNETLKKELPRLSALTEKVGNICLGNFVNIQAQWYLLWKEKVKAVIDDKGIPDVSEITASFQKDFQFAEDQFNNIKTLCARPPSIRTSQSTTDESQAKPPSWPTDFSSPRGRGQSANNEAAPSLPAPDFVRQNSGQLTLSLTGSMAGRLPSPGHYYRDFYSANVKNGQGQGSSTTPIAPDTAAMRSNSSAGPSQASPDTGRSYDSGSVLRFVAPDSPAQTNRADSNSNYNSTYNSNHYPQETRRFSGLFHSALPLPDGAEESQRSSRASSRERPAKSRYNILWLAASLFEFNIETTKHEAGYPYLTYQAGEIFDVIAEKGELWLAKNQDDPGELVGWIWSKHFAKFADS